MIWFLLAVLLDFSGLPLYGPDLAGSPTLPLPMLVDSDTPVESVPSGNITFRSPLTTDLHIADPTLTINRDGTVDYQGERIGTNAALFDAIVRTFNARTGCTHADVLAALRRVAPYLTRSTDVVSFITYYPILVQRSPAQKLRDQADVLEAKDAAIDQMRATLGACQ